MQKVAMLLAIGLSFCAAEGYSMLPGPLKNGIERNNLLETKRVYEEISAGLPADELKSLTSDAYSLAYEQEARWEKAKPRLFTGDMSPGWLKDVGWFMGGLVITVTGANLIKEWWRSGAESDRLYYGALFSLIGPSVMLASCFCTEQEDEILLRAIGAHQVKEYLKQQRALCLGSGTE